MKTTSVTLLIPIFLVGLFGQTYAAPTKETQNTTAVIAILGCLEEINNELVIVSIPERLSQISAYVKQNLDHITKLHVTLGGSPVDLLLAHEEMSDQKEAIKSECNQTVKSAIEALFRPQCANGIMKETNFWQNTPKYSHLIIEFAKIHEFQDIFMTCAFFAEGDPNSNLRVVIPKAKPDA